MPGTNIPKQRKHKRFEIPKAIVVTPGNVCQLVNISTGGLSFRCFREVVWPGKSKWLLNIITFKSDFDIEHCPVELVWLKTDDELIRSSVTVKNVGVQFSDLDQSQGAKLEYLLSQY